MIWKIEWAKSAEKEFLALDPPVQKRIARFLVDRLGKLDNPRRLGRALEGERRGLWRYRIGDWRILCLIEDDAVRILVVKVGHRKDVYRK